jgi:hypothetical protein
LASTAVKNKVLVRSYQVLFRGRIVCLSGYHVVRNQASCLVIRQQSGAKRLVCTLSSSEFPFWRSRFRMKAWTHTYFKICHISCFLILTILKVTIILPVDIVNTSECVNYGRIGYQFLSSHQRRVVGLSYVRVGAYSVLTPWSRVLLEKLTGLQLVKKFPAFYGTRRFITTFSSDRLLSLS